MEGVIGVAQMPPPLFQIGLLNNVILRGTRRRDSDDSALARRRSSRRRLSSKPLNLWFVIGDDGLQHALDNSVACAVEAAYRAERWFSEVIADATHVVKLFSAADVRIFVRDSKDDLLGRIVERDPTPSSTRRASPFPTHFPPSVPTTPLDIAQLPAEFRKFFAAHAANADGVNDDDDDDDDDEEDNSGDGDDDDEATEELDLDDEGDGATQATTTSDVVRKLFLWRFDDETAVDGEPVAPAAVLPLDNARCHLVLLIRDRTAPIAPSSAAVGALPPLSLEKLSTNARTAVSPRGLAHSFGSMPRDALSTRLFGTKQPPTSPNGTMRDEPAKQQQPTLVVAAALRNPNLVHELFVWNGSSASAFVRAACLSKGFELERALEADVGAVQALFDGRWQGAQAAPMCALVNDTTAPSGDGDGAPLNSLLFHLRCAAGVADGRMRARRQNLFERAPPRRVATDSEAMAVSRSASVSAIAAPASQRPTKSRGSVVNIKAKTVSVKRPLMSATSELPLPKMRTAATRDNGTATGAAAASMAASAEGGSAADIAARKVAFASTTNLQRDAKGRPTNISPNALKLKSMSFKPGLPKIDLTLVREVDKAPILSGAEQVRFFDPICSKITDCVYLGSRTPAMSRDMLKQNGITHILNCAGTICDNYFPDEFNYTTLALIDGGSEDIMCVLYHVLDLFEEVQRADGRVFVHCFPAADHQILTDRGFLFLDEVEALVERDATGAVRDWRGLKVASYDAATRQLCYETPRALVVNDAPADLVEISSADDARRLSVVATHEHALYVGDGSGDDRTFTKRAAHEVAAERGARHHFMTAAAAGVGAPRSKRRPALRTDNIVEKARASEQRRLPLSGASAAALDIADADLAALAELYGYCLGRGSGAASDDDDVFVRARRHVAPLLSACDGDERVAQWVFELDGALARRVVFGLEQRQQKTGAPGVLFAETAALRDDLQRVLLHAGFSVVFDGCESRWRLTYCDATTAAFAAGDGDVVERRAGVPGRTWCFDMSDGFVMVRRAHRAPLCDGGAPVVVAASRPTIQGNCHAGISRSSTFVVAYVMWKKRRSYEAALKQVKDIRATVSPNFGFNMQLHTWWTRINAPPQPRLYRVISHSQDPDFLVPKHVPTLSAASLDPRTCFVLHTAERVWAWHGERAMPRYRDACTRIHRQLVRYESAPSPLIGVQQGSEPAAFWAAIGGRAAVTESSAYNSDYSASVLYAKKPASLLNRAFVEEDSSQSDGERALLYLYPNNFLIDTVTAADFERVFVSEPEELEENCLYILVSARRDQLFAWLGREFTPPSGAPGAQFAMDALKSFKKLQQHLFAAPPRTTVVQGGAALNEQFVDTILTV